MLVPGGGAQVVSAIAAPAEVPGQPVKIHQRSWLVTVVPGSIQGTTFVAIVSALHTIQYA